MHIICLIGRSGCGKSTAERALERLGYNRIISYTTREPRGNEQSGVEYHFINKEQFEGLIDKGILMEYTEYKGNYYGAPKPVGSIKNVIVVESEGFETIKRLYGNQAIGVYIDTPLDVINKRLNKRMDTSESEQHERSKEDDRKFADIKSKVDLVVDGTKQTDLIVLDILKYVRRIGKDGMFNT